MITAFLAALEAEGGRGAHVADVPAARAYARELLGDDAAICFWSGDPLVTSLDPASLGRVTDPADAAAGITGADFGIAATGTLVLTYGTGRWRTTGLLPDLHIAVFGAERMVATLDEAVSRVYAGDAPRAMTLVTGASATSDIEKIRVVGAHGPRMVAAIIVG